MPEVSVVVPVYKVEKFIYRCVDSVLCQTFADFELILVDDGSPDGCGKICDEYAKKDSRIKVIHKSNGGLSDARNVGIDTATGDWLMFLDSDDWLHPETIKKLYDEAIMNDATVSICGFGRTAGENPVVDTEIKAELWTPKKLWFEERVTSTIACAKLYQKSCFEHVRYPVGKLHEDEFVTYRILFAQEKVAFINQPYYAYFTNPNGIMESKWNPSRLDELEAIEAQSDFFEKIGDKNLIEYNENMYLLRLVNAHIKAKSNGYKKECKVLKRKVLFMTLKNPKKVFSEKHIWVPENLFPKSMRIYWFIRSAANKLLGKNKK